MHTQSYQRGHAQGILLYPRPGLCRPLASMLLDALHIEYGKPTGGAEYRQFLAGYAAGQQLMEASMEQQLPPPAAPSSDPTVRVVTSYVQRLETMLEEQCRRSEAYRIAYEQAAQLVEMDGTNATMTELAEIKEGLADALPPTTGERAPAPPEVTAAHD